MTAFRNRTQATCCAIAFALAALCSGVVGAQDGASQIEVRELKAALSVAQTQIASLQEQMTRAELQRKALVKSLSEAVRVSEEQVAASRETQLKLQAFGVDLLTKDENSLEQRLLKAVRDLDISQQELDRRTKQLHELSESFMKYVQATPDASQKDRDAAMASVEKAGETMGSLAAEAEAGEVDVDASQVVSVDSEIGLVVFDAGKESGVRVGTPIAVLRGERPIYTAMIVDVRDAISGAVLQDRIADVENVAVGDGIKLLPNQPNF